MTLFFIIFVVFLFFVAIGKGNLFFGILSSVVGMIIALFLTVLELFIFVVGLPFVIILSIFNKSK
jgi:hypothetical protein